MTLEEFELTLNSINLEIEGLDAERVEIEKQIAALRLKRAELVCPFKVGDVIECRREGQYRITQIHACHREPFYELSCIRILKSGADGRTCKLSWFDLRDAKKAATVTT